MAEVQQVSIQCECHHRFGIIRMLTAPWALGRPCRRCRRMMERNVIVVPTSGAAVAVAPAPAWRSPCVVTTTTQTLPQPQPQVIAVPVQTAANVQMPSQQAYPATDPPRYELVPVK
ncbi:uncharacterized protein LOC117564586 [Drosophila albomicans]|uniref:Uncharacterized protein LOC117564586 n=1 Tax=Drosophila albomicans TaxID=7291 RepID=A0A6P8XL74_DROAB|nr:uncharacterized protein LOC117564586 [Drosophila albomicans]